MGSIVTAAEVRTWADLDVTDAEIDPVIDAIEAAVTIAYDIPGASPILDSWVTEADNGPTSGEHVQFWAPPFKQGVAFTALENIAVHGARWWRIGQAVTGVAPRLHVGSTTPFDFAEASAFATTPAPTVTGWETILFAAPVVVPAGETRVIWISSYVGDAINVARQGGYFVDATPSRLGLFESLDPTAHFELPAQFEADQSPGSTADAWYWIDPLVATPAPAPTADVKQAVMMQVARLWKRRDTPEGITRFGPEFGMRVNRFDPDIDMLLAPYRRWVIGGRQEPTS